MLKTAAVAAIAAASLASAASASAESADLVRVSIAGKTAAQVNAEVDAAAREVCGASDAACVRQAVFRARRQLMALIHLGDPADPVRVTILDGTVYAVRVSYQGQSRERLNEAADAAAVAVCRAPSAEPYACLAGALQNPRGQQLAANW